MNFTRTLVATAAIGLAPCLAAQETLTASGLAKATAALEVTSLTLQDIALPTDLPSWFRTDVELGGVSYELSFNKHSLRDPGFELLVQDATGQYTPTEPAPVRTYRGGIAGVGGARVAGSLRPDGLHAIVRLGDREFGIQPDETTGLHAVYESKDIIPRDVRCGNTGIPIGQQEPATSMSSGNGGPLDVTEIAIDSDNQFYLMNGSSVEATQDDIEAIMNAVNAIYDTYVDIVFSITVLIVRTDEPDPYLGDAFDRLDDLMAEFTGNLSPIPRDIAHLMSGIGVTSGVIGVAYLEAICDEKFGYGMSDSGFTSNFTSRVGLTAHELGHNFGAFHCSDGDPTCWIMCPFIGGCAGDVTQFGNQATGEITAFAGAIDCLGAEDDCGAQSYGLSVGNTTSLAIGGTLQSGTSMELVYANPASAPSAAVVGFSLGSGSSAFGPGTLLLDGGLFLFLTSGVTFSDIDVAETETIALPPASAGVVFYAQAAHIAGGVVSELSNGVMVEICP